MLYRSKLIKYALIVAGVVTLSSFLVASQVDIDMVREVAENHIYGLTQLCHYHNSTFDPTENYSIADIKTLNNQDGTQLLAYIVELKPRGFIAIAPNTDIEPVIAYSFNSTLALEDFEDNLPLHMLQDHMMTELDKVQTASSELLNENHREWHSYVTNSTGLQAKFESMEVYGPLIETAWRQDAPYDQFCPTHPTTHQPCKVGCCAVAMGQILNYFKYPSSIILTEDDSYQTIYDPIMWVDATEASMDTVDYNDGDPTDSTAAHLLFACGVISYTQYNPSQSGGLQDAEYYIDYLGYHNAVNIVRESDPDFYTKMKNSLMEYKPIQFSMFVPSEGMGHSMIIDGYNTSNSKCHLNFGWGNAYSGAFIAWFPDLETATYEPDDAVVDLIPYEGWVYNDAIKEVTSSYIPIDINIYPSPFTHSVTIAAPKGQELKIFDLQGNVIHKVDNLTTGAVTWQPEDDVASGLYIVEVVTRDNGRAVEKIAYMR